MKKLLLFVSVIVITLIPTLSWMATPVLATEEESFVCFIGAAKPPDGKEVTVIGDSITVGSNDALKKQLPGIKTYAQNSKQFSGSAPGNPTGIQVVKDSSTELRKYVVVALGTNGTIPAGHVQSMVDAIGKGKTIIFVNNYKMNDLSHYSSNNQQFVAAAKDNAQVHVADWANLANADPSAYIDNSDGLGVHPTEAGKQAFAQLIYDALNSATESSGAGGGGGGGGDLNGPAPTSLTGEDNIQKAWNYLKARGLSDIAAAGVTGNIAPESGFDPFKHEAGGGGGWGIIQWTPATLSAKPELHWLTDAGLTIGATSGDNDKYLLAELHALWERSGSKFWEELNQETTVGHWNPASSAPSANSNGRFIPGSLFKGKGSAYYYHAAKVVSDDGNWGIGGDGKPNPSQGGRGNVLKRPYHAELILQKYGGTGGSACGGGGGFNGGIAEVAKQMVATGGNYCWGGGHGSKEDLDARKDKQWRNTGLAHLDKSCDGSNHGLDCTGFTRTAIYLATGVDTGDFIAEQSPGVSNKYLKEVANSDIQPGDIMFTAGHAQVVLEVLGGGSYKIAQSGWRAGQGFAENDFSIGETSSAQKTYRFTKEGE